MDFKLTSYVFPIDSTWAPSWSVRWMLHVLQMVSEWIPKNGRPKDVKEFYNGFLMPFQRIANICQWVWVFANAFEYLLMHLDIGRILAHVFGCLPMRLNICWCIWIFADVTGYWPMCLNICQCVLIFAKYFKRVLHAFQMDFQRIPDGFPKDFRCILHGSHMDFQRTSDEFNFFVNGFPMDFKWVSNAFPMYFECEPNV